MGFTGKWLMATSSRYRQSSFDTETSSVISKITAILQAFDDADSGLNLKQIIERTGVPRSTAHRLCNELVNYEMLSRNKNLYDLGRIIIGASGQTSEFKNLRAVAEPYLYDLFAETKLGVHLAIRQGLTTRFLARIVSASTKTSISRIWGERPLYTTASGKCFLAFSQNRTMLLDQVFAHQPKPFTANTMITKGVLQADIRKTRELGYASEYEELLVGWRAIAAPIWRDKTEIVATVSMSAEIDREDFEKNLPALIKTAKKISKHIRE
jgi:DNA-binding IclR family transcriptional regulator